MVRPHLRDRLLRPARTIAAEPPWSIWQEVYWAALQAFGGLEISLGHVYRDSFANASLGA